MLLKYKRLSKWEAYLVTIRHEYHDRDKLSSFLLNRQVTAVSYLKKTGTHFDSIQFFRSIYGTATVPLASVLDVEYSDRQKKVSFLLI